MVLKGVKPEKVRVGDTIVFVSHREKPKLDPIIHRVMSVESGDKYVFKTKGDNNPTMIRRCYDDNLDGLEDACIDETDIWETQLLGEAVVRIPVLGYIKIWAFDLFSFGVRLVQNVLS